MPLPDTTTTADTPTRIPIPSSPHRSQKKPRNLPENIRIRNRRRRYLESHLSYFGPSLEPADLLLYDRLIRAHQSTAERTSERAAKGFAGTLEADLLRSEAKLDEVRARGQRSNPSAGDKDENGDAHKRSSSNARPVRINEKGNDGTSTSTSASASASAPAPAPAPSLTPLPIPPNDFTSLTRDEAHQHWIEIMTARFVRGEDHDFEYDVVDGDDGLDDLRGEERDREEEWFDGEEEEFVSGGENEDGDEGIEGEGKGRELKGETGIQDF